MRTLYIILSILPLLSCSGIPVLFPSSEAPLKQDKEELPAFIRISDSIKNQEPFLKNNPIDKNAKTIECEIKAETDLNPDPFVNEYLIPMDYEEKKNLNNTYFEIKIDICNHEHDECSLKFTNLNKKNSKLETNLKIPAGELLSDRDEKFVNIFRVNNIKEIIMYNISYENGAIIVLERNSWTQGGTVKIGECKEFKP